MLLDQSDSDGLVRPAEGSPNRAIGALRSPATPRVLLAHGIRKPRSGRTRQPDRTSRGTMTRTQRTSPPQVCGSPSRPGPPEAAASARLYAIRTPLRRRDDRARLFPNGRISTLSVAWCLTAPFSSEGECRSRSASPVSSCQLTARTFDTRRLVVALRLLRHRVSADCPRHPMTRT